jgi:hypothetical protein
MMKAVRERPENVLAGYIRWTDYRSAESRIVWTIFCIPLNEYGFVTLFLTSRRIIGIPSRGSLSKTASASA